jgi:hypothetical protein
MKLKALMRWVGPAAIGAGVFMVFSELSDLPIHVPYLSQNDPNGYQVVGSGLILFALTLLLVGMLGLYAGRASSAGPKVIESGVGYPRHEGSELRGSGPGRPRVGDGSTARSAARPRGGGSATWPAGASRSRTR